MVSCIHEDCTKRALYNYVNLTTRLYCAKHKKLYMVNVNDNADVYVKNEHLFCIHPDCKTVACFNYENEKLCIYCAKHKKADMINILEKQSDERLEERKKQKLLDELL